LIKDARKKPALDLIVSVDENDVKEGAVDQRAIDTGTEILAVDDAGFAWAEWSADAAPFREALSSRERQVLALRLKGFRQADIARRLKIRHQTVSGVLDSLKQKSRKFFPEAR
jgi:DNA-binding NarL/FixJ family response regulator